MRAIAGCDPQPRGYFHRGQEGELTLGRHLHVRLKRHMSSVRSRVGITCPPDPDHTAIQGPGGILIPAVPEDLIVGEVEAFARDRNIESIPIPGYWIHRDEKLPFESPPSRGEKVFYLCHGGGYVASTTHLEGVNSRILKGFLQYSQSSTIRRRFAVEYRLSSLSGEPGNGSVSPFLAALVDALAGYLYLIKIGFSEEDIILVGDSAGGSLALALIRYILSSKEQQSALPNIPSSLVLFSPWVDLTGQMDEHPDPHSSLTLNAHRDWINTRVLTMDARAFLGGRPERAELAYRNPYISPASPILLGLTPDSPTRTVSFNGFPRRFIDNGTFECFYDQIRRLGEAIVEDLGE